MKWELLEKPGMPPTEFTLEAEIAIKLLSEAIVNAEKYGLVWQKDAVKLTPSPNLVALLKKSQEIAAKTPAAAVGE
jgi:CRISPR-associated protein Csb1